MRRLSLATRRAVLLQMWRAAQKRIEVDGVAQLSMLEDAGRLLAKWENARVAHALCPGEETRELLAEVIREEGDAPSPGRNAS